MTIKPGYGLQSLHLRQSANSLKALYGPPRKRRKISELREYWLYPDYGFDCIVSKRSHRVLSLFLHRSQQVAPIEEFSWHETMVKEAYCEPQQAGGGFLMGSILVDRWFTYDAGIGFHFDTDGNVNLVAIFAEKAVSKAKRPVHASRHRMPELIAALRQ
jgi:hypothetical protein